MCPESRARPIESLEVDAPGAECEGVIVSASDFLCRNDGTRILAETRPYLFNFGVTGGLEDAEGRSGLGGSPLARSYWHGVRGEFRDAFTLLSELRVRADPVVRLIAENNIAYWHGASGDHATAVRMFGLLARDAAIMFGPGHVTSVAARGSAAHWLARRGQVGEGIRLLDEMLVTCVSDGLSARDILLLRNNRAFWVGESGDGARALGQFTMLLRDVLTELGADDFYALATRNNVAYWSGYTGDVGRALHEYRTLRAECQRLLGEFDHHTLSAQLQIALWTGVDGRAEEALSQLESLLPIAVNSLGADSELSLSVRHQMARWSARAGDEVRAVDLLKTLVRDQAVRFGEQDFRTRASQGLLDRYR